MDKTYIKAKELCSQESMIFEVRETSKRLFDASQQKKKQEAREKRRLQNELKGCTFVPRINKYQVKLNSKPIEGSVKNVGDRLYERYKADIDKQRALREKRLREEKNNLTFKPKVSGGNKNIVSGSNVFDRLTSSNRNEKLLKLQKAKAERELKECTFAPKLNRRSADYDERNSSCVDSLHRSVATLSTASEKDASVFKRLDRDNSMRALRRSKQKDTKIKQELKGWTFDARKTIAKIRKEQMEAGNLQLSVDVEESNVQDSALTSIEVGSSCFQHALNLVRFSARVATTNPKAISQRCNNAENCPITPNLA